MTQIESAPRDAGTWGTWQSILLGLVLVLAGLVVLRNATAATVASTFIFGVVLLATGMLEVAEAFLSTHWGGFLWRMLMGVLYAIGGGVLIADPLAASVMMTLVFVAVLIASGAMRVFLALSHWGRFGWLLLASGAVGILAGLVILSNGRSADCGSLVWWLASTYCCTASGGWCLAGKSGKSSVLPRDDTSRSPRVSQRF